MSSGRSSTARAAAALASGRSEAYQADSASAK